MPDPQKEGASSADTLDAPGGIQALPARVARYEAARKRALDTAEYIGATRCRGHRASVESRRWSPVYSAMQSCGEYLQFRHYQTVDTVRLSAAQFCKKHLLCPLCAVRRGARALGRYLERYEVVQASNGALRPFLVTLTVKDGPDLAERFRHLRGAVQKLGRRRRHKDYTWSQWHGIEGAVWSYEVKRGRNSGEWHPHAHMVVMAEPDRAPDAHLLAGEWQHLTGDSHIVDVRPIDLADPAGGFAEVFKYAVKFSDMDLADTVAAYEVLAGERLLASSGCFYNVDVPEDLTDVQLDDLPYVELLYRYIRGKGYSLVERKAATQAPPKPKREPFVWIKHNGRLVRAQILDP